MLALALSGTDIIRVKVSLHSSIWKTMHLNGLEDLKVQFEPEKSKVCKIKKEATEG